MNNQMLKLYKLAHLPHTAIDPSNNMPYETTLFSPDKFAELIVQVCQEACVRAIDIKHLVPPTQQKVVLSCMEEIAKTFGGEE